MIPLPRPLAILFCAGASLLLPAAALCQAPTVDVIVVDGLMSESWPDDGVVAFRREGIIGDLTLSFTVSGSATRGVDYTVASGDSITIPDGEREVWLNFTPSADAITPEKRETIVINLQANPDLYSLPVKAARRTVTLTLDDANGKPAAKEAIRFLWQAAFGPNADSASDANLIPENAEAVMSLGFEKWINAQFKKPRGSHQGILEAADRNGNIPWDIKSRAWWKRAMDPATPDVLRQRVAFAFSEIFVISDRLEVLAANSRGMLNFYDVLLKHSFGNVRDLLRDVSLHPCMGAYLSHLKNRKANPALGTFPDENYGREVMQLFSIGLWELNADGTPKLDNLGQKIPTYDNVAVTNFARVFTGLSFGGPRGNQFWWPRENWTAPMRMWDEYHDVDAKVLLNGVTLPARAADPVGKDKGTAGMLDIEGAVDCLFNHPNIAPFLGKQLIQRFVTSNPSPAYVGRVSAAFADNGSGVRGDMKAIMKAVLLDPEARDVGALASPTFGKMKEPFLRSVGLSRAFNSRSKGGTYIVDLWGVEHGQQPLSSPSVFNFFRPGFTPAGPISDAHLVAPEFQILNAVTAVSVPNYHNQIIRRGFNWYRDGRKLEMNLNQEMKLWDDIPALMQRLDLVLTGGMLDPLQHQNIREAVESIHSGIWEYKKERIGNAIYLIATLPEYAIQQ